MIGMNLFKPKAAAKLELLFNMPASNHVPKACKIYKILLFTFNTLISKLNVDLLQVLKRRFVELKLKLRCTFRWDHIHNNNISKFCHTLLCSLGLT